jgi:hypothetical protein
MHVLAAAFLRPPEPAVTLAVTALVAGTDKVFTARALAHIGGRADFKLFLDLAHNHIDLQMKFITFALTVTGRLKLRFVPAGL